MVAVYDLCKSRKVCEGGDEMDNAKLGEETQEGDQKKVCCKGMYKIISIMWSTECKPFCKEDIYIYINFIQKLKAFPSLVSDNIRWFSRLKFIEVNILELKICSLKISVY